MTSPIPKCSDNDVVSTAYILKKIIIISTNLGIRNQNCKGVPETCDKGCNKGWN